MRGRLIPLLIIVIASCGEKEPDAAAPALVAGSDAAAASLETADTSRSEWIDPEPPEAQKLAEAVVGAEWNGDKSTPLTMRITRLVDRRSGIEGFGTALAAREVPVDERLDRLGATVTGQQIVIRLPGSLLFDFDKADIRADAERTLAELTEVIEAYAERPVRIEGHTDSIASDVYNQTLSERRANSVAAWLIGRGVKSSRLSTTGFGESLPIGDNETAEGRQQNRRVEVVIGASS